MVTQPNQRDTRDTLDAATADLLATLRRAPVSIEGRRRLMALTGAVLGAIGAVRQVERLRGVGMVTETADTLEHYWDQIDDAMRAAIWEARNPDQTGEGVAV